MPDPKHRGPRPLRYRDPSSLPPHLSALVTAPRPKKKTKAKVVETTTPDKVRGEHEAPIEGEENYELTLADVTIINNGGE